MNGDIFKRMDLRQISSFILFCDENPNIENLTYKERIKNGTSPIRKRLEQIYQNDEELENAVADLNEALTIYEEVFMEIGMKSGAKIVLQLLQDNYS